MEQTGETPKTEHPCTNCRTPMRPTLGGVLHCDGCGKIAAPPEWLRRYARAFEIANRS